MIWLSVKDWAALEKILSTLKHAWDVPYLNENKQRNKMSPFIDSKLFSDPAQTKQPPYTAEVHLDGEFGTAIASK